MSGRAMPLAILSTGLVTPVGLSAPASCAAFRAKISNPTETRFMGSDGEWIMAHQVPLEQPWRGLTKLAKMAAMAIEEALEGVPRVEWGRIPLLLCVAERERPGRLEGLEERLFGMVCEAVEAKFDPVSGVVPRGRVAVAVAMTTARALIGCGAARRVLVVATDSLLLGPSLQHYQDEGRLLGDANSNGFMPGEGAGAILVASARESAATLVCLGIGFGIESAPIGSEAPLRAEGLTQAVRSALQDAGRGLHEIDFRITDNAGEHFEFKESALLLSRLLRIRKEEFELWQPAECTGQIGAAVGASVVAWAKASCEKRYARGPGVLAHLANDAGERAALALFSTGAT